MVIYASNLEASKEALLDYLKVDCIRSFSFDERCALVTFNDTPKTEILEEVVQHLGEGIFLTYNGDRFKIHTQYFDI